MGNLVLIQNDAGFVQVFEKLVSQLGVLENNLGHREAQLFATLNSLCKVGYVLLFGGCFWTVLGIVRREPVFQVYLITQQLAGYVSDRAPSLDVLPNVTESYLANFC